MLYAGAAVAMLVAWYFLLYGPLGRQRAEINGRTEQAKQQMLEFRRIMAELPVYLETHQSLERTRSDINESLYARDEILELFALITEQAQIYDLEVLEISPPVEELLLLNNLMPSPDKPPFLNLTVRLRGGYVSFGKYVSFVETAPFFRGVNLCQVSSSPDDYDTPTSYVLGFRALLGQLEGTS
jgi:hypothetical protein